jgi:uncharacterized SAM-dependent methyltransferase
MRAPASNLHWINEHLTRQRVTLLDRLDLDLPEERRTLLDGLHATPATIAPKYFYDAEGSARSKRSARCPVLSDAHGR